MVTNNVTYVFFEGAWLASSNYFVRGPEEKAVIRSYDGSFLMGGDLKYRTIKWESELPASLEEIEKHAPKPYMSPQEYQAKMEAKYSSYEAAVRKEAMLEERGFKWVLVILAIIMSVVIGLVL